MQVFSGTLFWWAKWLFIGYFCTENCNKFILNSHYWSNRMCACKVFSVVCLFAILWTIAHQAPMSMGFSRQEYWSGLLCPLPGNLPDPGIEPGSPTSPAPSDRFFTTSATWLSTQVQLVICGPREHEDKYAWLQSSPFMLKASLHTRMVAMTVMTVLMLDSLWAKHCSRQLPI